MCCTWQDPVVRDRVMRRTNVVVGRAIMLVVASLYVGRCVITVTELVVSVFLPIAIVSLVCQSQVDIRNAMYAIPDVCVSWVLYVWCIESGTIARTSCTHVPWHACMCFQMCLCVLF